MQNGKPFSEDRISSEDLAALIIDALVDAQIVERANFDRAVKIAKEEIDVRKIAGD